MHATRDALVSASHDIARRRLVVRGEMQKMKDGDANVCVSSYLLAHFPDVYHSITDIVQVLLSFQTDRMMHAMTSAR